MYLEVYAKTLPIILFILTGWAAKRLGILGKKQGEALVWLVFNVTLPATIFLALLQVELSKRLVFLPLSAVCIILANYPIARTVAKKLDLTKETTGTFVIATMIINMGFFAYPLIKLYYGSEGLARAAFFDLGHVLIVFTFVYFIAARFGREDYNTKEAVRRFFSFPPIWALAIAIPVNAYGIGVSGIIITALRTLDWFTIPLVMLTLGIFLEFQLQRKVPLVTVVGLRMGLGLILGGLFSTIFGLEGLDKQVVIISSMMPIGVNSMVFSARENLDVEFAARAVSLSIVVGLIIVPFVIAVL